MTEDPPDRRKTGASGVDSRISRIGSWFANINGRGTDERNGQNGARNRNDDRNGTDDEELRRALAFLERDRTPEWIERRARHVGLIVAAIITIVTLPLVGSLGSTSVAAIAGLASHHVRRRWPCWLAELRRTRALGTAPGLIGRIVLRMRLEPATERAVEFAAQTGTGPLAGSLTDAVRRSDSRPGSGLRAFTEEWHPWFPALERAGTRIRAAASAPAERRDRGLDRALEAVVDGTTDRMAAFIGDIRGPISGLYAFGVLLPLALVALLPAARATGLPLGATTMAVVYVVILPTVLTVASGWILLRRPVAFPPPTIDSTHPAVPKRRLSSAVAGALTGVIGWLIGSLLVAWSAPIVACGFGVGSGAFLLARPRRRVLSRVRAIESALPDALAIVGGHVADGVSVERAVRHAGEAIDGPAGEAFDAAARRSRTLRVDIESALCGNTGPFANVPSPRVQGAIALLAIAAREGRPAGDVVIEFADQLEELRTLERDATRRIATVTRTIANTATVFGPLVGGATVALASGMEGGTIAAGAALDPTAGGPVGGPTATGGLGATPVVEPIPVPVLGRIVGIYVLLLAAILTGLSTLLERGFDPTLVSYRIAIALPTATATYLASFLGANLLL
ncbi:type II secretion system F family protein [Halopenitus sp. H-Gu1]|uniref:type II secretion system F family protein n=1 Tax=Halopenitus sp. H-Gu1 TaxID=3242697 RepID=UPI00359D022A